MIFLRYLIQNVPQSLLLDWLSSKVRCWWGYNRWIHGLHLWRGRRWTQPPKPELELYDSIFRDAPKNNLIFSFHYFLFFFNFGLFFCNFQNDFTIYFYNLSFIPNLNKNHYHLWNQTIFFGGLWIFFFF